MIADATYGPDSIVSVVERARHPYLGPDKLGSKTLPIWNASTGRNGWKPFKITPFKREDKPTKTSTAHVEMSQRVFRNDQGLEFRFWALAPVKPGMRRGRQKNAEFVWLTLELGNGRGLHHALVDQETDEVYWYDSVCANYHAIECQEVAAT